MTRLGAHCEYAPGAIAVVGSVFSLRMMERVNRRTMGDRWVFADRVFPPADRGGVYAPAGRQPRASLYYSGACGRVRGVDADLPERFDVGADERAVPASGCARLAWVFPHFAAG